MTEITKQTESSQLVDSWLVYDGDCPMCTRWVRRVTPLLARRGIATAAFQTPWVRTRLGMSEGMRPTEMLLLSKSGATIGGADAVVGLAKRFWFTRPFASCCRLPLIMRLLRAIYRWMAAHRTCSSNACSMAKPTTREVG